MAAEVDRTLGSHDARLDAMEKRLDTIETHLAHLNQFVTSVRGGWKAVILVAAVAGGLFKWLLDYVTQRPHS